MLKEGTPKIELLRPLENSSQTRRDGLVDYLLMLVQEDPANLNDSIAKMIGDLNDTIKEGYNPPAELEKLIKALTTRLQFESVPVKEKNSGFIEQKGIIEHGEFALDFDTLKAYSPHRKTAITLPPAPRRLFQHLVANKGKVVPYETLLYKLWPESDSATRVNLATHATRLRRALGDSVPPHHVVKTGDIGYSLVTSNCPFIGQSA